MIYSQPNDERTQQPRFLLSEIIKRSRPNQTNLPETHIRFNYSSTENMARQCPCVNIHGLSGEGAASQGISTS